MDTDAQVATVSSLLDILPTMGYEDAQELLRKNGWSVEAAVSAHFAAVDRASAPPAPRVRQLQVGGPDFGEISDAIEGIFPVDETEEAMAKQEAFRRRREEEKAAEKQRNRFWDAAMCLRHGEWGSLSEGCRVVRECLDAGQPVDAIGGPRDSTALHDACYTRRAPIVRLLLERGADPNRRYSDRRPYVPESYDIARDIGPSIDHAFWGRRDGDTPLHTVARAAVSGCCMNLADDDSEQCIRLLLAAGADPFARTPRRGLTAAEVACAELSKDEQRSVARLDAGEELLPPPRVLVEEAEARVRDDECAQLLQDVVDFVCGFHGEGVSACMDDDTWSTDGLAEGEEGEGDESEGSDGYFDDEHDDEYGAVGGSKSHVGSLLDYVEDARADVDDVIVFDHDGHGGGGDDDDDQGSVDIPDHAFDAADREVAEGHEQDDLVEISIPSGGGGGGMMSAKAAGKRAVVYTPSPRADFGGKPPPSQQDDGSGDGTMSSKARGKRRASEVDAAEAAGAEAGAVVATHKSARTRMRMRSRDDGGTPAAADAAGDLGAQIAARQLARRAAEEAAAERHRAAAAAKVLTPQDASRWRVGRVSRVVTRLPGRRVFDPTAPHVAAKLRAVQLLRRACAGEQYADFFPGCDVGEAVEAEAAAWGARAAQARAAAQASHGDGAADTRAAATRGASGGGDGSGSGSGGGVGGVGGSGGSRGAAGGAAAAATPPAGNGNGNGNGKARMVDTPPPVGGKSPLSSPPGAVAAAGVARPHDAFADAATKQSFSRTAMGIVTGRRSTTVDLFQRSRDLPTTTPRAKSALSRDSGGSAGGGAASASASTSAADAAGGSGGDSGDGGGGEQWACKACTLLNPPQLRVCSICDSPRGFVAIDLTN